MENIITKSFINPIIYNPVDHIIYQDSGKSLNEDYEYQNPILNARAFQQH